MHSFNWLSLDRTIIIDHITSLKPQLIKKEIPIDKFHRILTNHIHKLAPVKFKKNKDAHEHSKLIYIGGLYHGDLDQERKKCIELVFEYSFLDENVYISTSKFKRITKLIADTLLHEIMHMQQYRSRKFKVSQDYNSNSLIDHIRREQEYLGCPDEMDAYSFNIACELVDYFGNDKNKISTFLNNKILSRKRIAPSWNKYFKTFEKNHNHPIIKKMKNKIIRYVPKAVKGKPYRKNIWLSR